MGVVLTSSALSSCQLDTRSEQVVQRALDKLLRDVSSGQRTTFMIAHRLSTVMVRLALSLSMLAQCVASHHIIL